MFQLPTSMLRSVTCCCVSMIKLDRDHGQVGGLVIWLTVKHLLAFTTFFMVFLLPCLFGYVARSDLARSRALCAVIHGLLQLAACLSGYGIGLWLADIPWWRRVTGRPGLRMAVHRRSKSRGRRLSLLCLWRTAPLQLQLLLVALYKCYAFTFMPLLQNWK